MERYVKYLKNKYILISVGMITWLLFFDDNNMVYRYQAEHKLNKLEEDRAYYSRKISEMQQKHRELSGDDASLKKFAREEFLMKKQDEDIFIIIEE